MKKFQNLLHRLQKRGSMYIIPYSYHTLVSYISGYDHYHLELFNKSLLFGFKEWIEVKVGHHCSLSWAYVILDLFANNNEEKAIELFFKFYEEFINECEKNGIKSIIDNAAML